jgi:hypothetical protein
MQRKKRLGIWMNHSDAHLMEFKTDIIEINTIESTFSHQENTEEAEANERKRQTKEKKKQAKFYKDLSDTIQYYDEVVIFGPTEEKNKLVDILESDSKFANIKIEVKDTNHLTENQQHTFVKEHFLKN